MIKRAIIDAFIKIIIQWRQIYYAFIGKHCKILCTESYEFLILATKYRSTKFILYEKSKYQYRGKSN
jgi:hypothetical protein